MIALILAAALLPTQVDSRAFVAKMVAAAAAPAQRVEHWTYHVGSQTIPVTVNVRGADYRASFVLDALPYASGRLNGERWRSDGNGVVHRTLADLQGDAADRLPDAAFPIDPSVCTVVGERAGGAAIVVEEHAPDDRPHVFDVDLRSGVIGSEETREGRRVLTYRFARAADGSLTGWRAGGAGRAYDIDVSVTDTRAAAVAEAGVAIPLQARAFAGPATDAMQRLPARFYGDSAWVQADVAGHRAQFLIDSGTENITMSEAGLRALGYQPVLEHATIPTILVGDESLVNAGVYVTQLSGASLYGILGYDWFFGHVVHISYAQQIVEVGSDRAAAAIFADPATTVVPIDVSQSIPFASASLNGVTGTKFALDTGSRQLMIFTPFFRAHPEAADGLKPIRIGGTHLQEQTSYLEGPLVVEARQASTFQFALRSFGQPEFETDVAAKSVLQFPFDGIIGTDVLRGFDLWFDYDHNRIGLRPAQ